MAFDRYAVFDEMKNAWHCKVNAGKASKERYVDFDDANSTAKLTPYFEAMEEEIRAEEKTANGDSISNNSSDTNPGTGNRRLTIPALPAEISYHELRQALTNIGFNFTHINFNRIDFFTNGVYVEVDASDENGFPQHDQADSWAMHRVFIRYTKE